MIIHIHVQTELKKENHPQLGTAFLEEKKRNWNNPGTFLGMTSKGENGGKLEMVKAQFSYVGFSS